MRRTFILAPICALALANCAEPPVDPGRDAEPLGVAANALTTTCVQIQRGTFGTVTDTAVDSIRSTTNYGSAAALSTGIIDGATRYAVFRFDVSSIPASATIASANLSMSLYASSTGAGTLNAHRLTGAWSESTVTWSTFNGVFDPTIVATSPNSAPSFDLTGLVAQWVSSATPNYGVLIEQSTYKTLFNASEVSSVSARPSLQVCYDRCTDGVKNGTETGVDCGGSCAAKCAVGGGCSVGGDCQTGACASGVCLAAPPCSDGVKGGLETDVDCGGGVCGSCGLGNTCLIDEDCVTGSCQSGVCQALPTVASGCTVPATSPNLVTTSDLVYSTPTGYGANYANKLDIYRLNDNVDRALVIFIHGGGWHGGSKIEASSIANCQLLASLGYVCASIDYRLDTTSATQTVPAFSPIHEADTRCAVRWLRTNAAAYHIDASRIFSMGISAGAHLAVSLAIDSELTAFDDGSCSTATSAKVNGAVGSFGVYDLRSTAFSTWGSAQSPAPPDISNFIHGGDAALVSPILHIDRQDSPLLFLHGSADWVLYPVTSQNMMNAALSAGVAATTWIEPTALHGYHWWDPGYSGSACTLINFLAKTAPHHP